MTVLDLVHAPEPNDPTSRWDDPAVIYDPEAIRTGLERSTIRRMYDVDEMARIDAGMAEILAYWTARRGSREMPEVKAVRPEEVGRLLPNLVLVDVLGGAPWFRYRLVGTRQAAMRGDDPTGLAVDGNSFGARMGVFSNFDVLLNYRYVVAFRRPLFTGLRQHRVAEMTSSFTVLTLSSRGTVLLPLADAASRVVRVLAYSAITMEKG